MNIKGAFKGRVAQHFGLCDNDKFSTTGCMDFTYQSIAVLVCTAIALYSGTALTAGPLTSVIVTVVCAIGFFSGARLLIWLMGKLSNRIAAMVTHKALRFAVTLVVMLASLAVIMSWPAAFLFVLAKLMPTGIGFAGWQSAFASGFTVIAADTILGGLTGVSLLSGKRAKLLNTASTTTVSPGGDSSVAK